MLVRNARAARAEGDVSRLIDGLQDKGRADGNDEGRNYTGDEGFHEGISKVLIGLNIQDFPSKMEEARLFGGGLFQPGDQVDAVLRDGQSAIHLVARHEVLRGGQIGVHGLLSPDHL